MIGLPQKCGSTVAVAAHGATVTVKKHSAGCYVAYMGERPKEHARWGNACEIRQDINYFMEVGALPRGKSGTF